MKNLCASAMIANKYSLHPHLLQFTRGNGLLDLGRDAIQILRVRSKTKTFLLHIPNGLKLFALRPRPLLVSFKSSDHSSPGLGCRRWWSQIMGIILSAQSLSNSSGQTNNFSPLPSCFKSLAERAVQTVKRDLKKV